MTRSAFGSITRTLRPALMSARISFSMAVLLPLPVGPTSKVCSRLSPGRSPAPADLRDQGSHRSCGCLLVQPGGNTTWAAAALAVQFRGSRRGSSPAGRSRKLPSSLTDRRSKICFGRCTLLSLSAGSASARILTPAASKVWSADRMEFTWYSASLPDAPRRMMTLN